MHQGNLVVLSPSDDIWVDPTQLHDLFRANTNPGGPQSFPVVLKNTNINNMEISRWNYNSITIQQHLRN